ncbi:MAG: 6-phosphogluconolactonase [Betaproteobacteria bacterium]
MFPITEPAVIICRNADDLAPQAAAQFVSLAANAAIRSSRFTVALSGGSTPRALYSLLAAPALKDRIDWRRIHFFWGDERCVRADHSESNYRMVHEALLSKIEIPPENIHRMAGEKEPQLAASEYEDELRRTFQLTHGQVPRFELILLGLGEDGHTASLFPGSAALDETNHLVATAYVEKLKAHRLTLTLSVINAASQVSFLVSGASKSAIVKQILGATPARPDYPAARVNPANGSLTWFLDAPAATGLR